MVPSAAMSVHVRAATKADSQAFVSLVRKLAEYEKLEPPSPDAEQRLLRDAFGERPRIDVLIAELDGRPVAYAIFFETYSSFLAQPTLYLEDLFVRPEARGRGIGKEMMRHLAGTALDLGCGRFVWQVLDWNTPSIEFYESLGGQVVREWLTCRVDGDALQALAGR